MVEGGGNMSGIESLPEHCLQLILNKISSPGDCSSASLVCKSWLHPARAACWSLSLKEGRDGCSWKDLAKLIKDFTEMETLSLELLGHRSKVPIEFFEAVSTHCTRLMSLTIKGPGGIEELGLWKLLGQCAKLKHLDLSDAFLEPPWVPNNIPWPRHSVEELCMGSCMSSLWDDDAHRTVAPAQHIVSSSTNLRILRLRDWWGCDDDTCQTICQCPTLLEVDLSFTSLSSFGLSIIRSSKSGGYVYSLS